MPFYQAPVPNNWPPGPDCQHPKRDIDRRLCPCGSRHVYCVACEHRIDQGFCPWIPGDEVFRSMMRHLWGGGSPADTGLD